MNITEVTLANFGPFGQEPASKSQGYSFDGKRHRFRLVHGSVGLFGPNGSGKTTLVDAVYAGLTSDFFRFDGARIDCVNNAADPKVDECSIGVEFEHDGNVLALVRTLTPKPKFSLRVNKGPAIASPEKGMDEMRTRGIDRRVLDFCVFKRQPGSERHAIDDFLRTTPGARAEAYQILNDTESCQVVHDVLNKMLADDRDLVTVVVDNSDDLTVQIAELKRQDRAHEEEIEQLRGDLMLPDHRDKAREVIRVAARVTMLRGNVAAWAKELNEVRAAVEEAAATETKRRAKLKGIYEELTAIEPRAEEARRALKTWSQVAKIRDRLAKLKAEKKQLYIEGQTNKPPQPPDEGKSVEELRSLRAAMTHELAQARTIVKAFDDKGLTECPTCGTQVASLGERIEAARLLLVSQPLAIQEVNRRIDALTDYAVKRDAHVLWKARYETRLKANEESLAHVESLGEPDLSAEEAQSLIDRHDELVSQAETWEGKVQESGKAVAGLHARRHSLETSVNKANAEIDSVAISEAVVERATKRLAEHAETEVRIGRIEGRREGLLAQIADKKGQLEEVRARLRKSKKARRVVKILEGVRDAFHRQALPQKVAQANLSLMVGSINKGLEMFGAPFWVEPDENLSFLVHKAGEPPHRAERLSGGQKIVLGMSFWPAVNSLYKAGMGMLVLDEPTANLDEANIDFLRQAMSKLTRRVRGKRQLIMITHADQLKPSFDQVIELGRV